MKKKVGFWLLIALSLPVVTGCDKADPKARERDAELKKIRVELDDHQWEIAALKAKLADPAPAFAKTRDLLIGKWAGVESSKTEGTVLDFTRDGIAMKTIKSGQPGGNLDVTITGPYFWFDGDRIGFLALKEAHKVVVTKDDLTLTAPDGSLAKYKRAN